MTDSVWADNLKWIGERWDDFKQGVTGLFRSPFTDQGAIAQDIANIGFSSLNNSDKNKTLNLFSQVVSLVGDYGQEKLGNLGQIASPILQAPGPKQLSEGMTWVQKTALRGPTTLMLAADTADKGQGASWAKAWDDSSKVTFGQAATYTGMQVIGQIDPNDPDYDPRVSKDKYKNDWFYRTASGSMDFAASFADPLRGLSKVARLSKARLLDKVVSEKQIAEGALEKQTFGKHAEFGQSFEEAGGQLSPGAERLYQTYQALPEDTAARLYFNQYALGGVISTGLSAAAKSGAENSRAMFADVLMAARGSYEASNRLATYRGGAALADAIGRYRNPYGIANTVARQADDLASYEQATAQAESAERSIVDQLVLSSPSGTPEYGTLANTTSAMLGAPMPKVRPNYDAFRIGIHNLSTGSYVPLQVAPWYLRAINKSDGLVRILTPSHGWGSHLDVNWVGSYRMFRANLERGAKYMDADTRNQYMTAYMAALTANERARIAGHADSFIIGRIAYDHGLTRAEAEQLMKDATARRQNFRNILNSRVRFLPTAFRKRANQLLRAGAREEASVLQDAADRYLVAARNGEVPGYYIQASDDMGRPIFVDGRPQLIQNPAWENPYTPQLFSRNGRVGRYEATPQLEEADPLLTSQVADFLPMVDYQAFERALGRYARPRRTIERYRADQERIAAGLEPQYNVTEGDYRKALTDRAINGVRGAVTDVYDAFNHVWSIAAILRPAQVLRNLGDDGTRVLSLIGVTQALYSGTQGAARIAYNIAPRTGLTWGRQREIDRAMRAIDGTTHHEVAVDELGVPRSHGQEPSDSAGYYNYVDPRGTSGPLTIGTEEIYPSLEAALNQGRIDLSTYIAFLPWAARHGRLPWDLNAIVEEWAMGFYGQGIRGRQGLQREVVEYVRDTLGDGAVWTQPRWQQDVADVVNVLAERTRGRGRTTGGVVFNPLGDEAFHTLDREAAKRYEFVAHKHLDRNPETGLFDNLDALYEFANSHAEKLLFGNYKLHAKIAEDGRVRFSVVRDMRAPRPLAERMTKQQRQDALRGLKRRGSSGTRFVDGVGTVTVPGVFTGMAGDYLKSAASAAYTPRPFVKGQRNADRAWQWNKQVDRGDVHPYIQDADGRRMPNPGWAAEYEQAVNHQLANDEAARRFLEGQEEAQVLEWLDSDDPSALRYLNDRPKLGMTIAQHVSTVRANVDYLAPPEGGQALRDKILRHEATGQDVKSMVPENLWPTVNGQVTTASLGTHPVLKWVQRRLDNWFTWMQDKPMDFLVRYPFIDIKYKSYFNPMFDNYMKQHPGTMISEAEKSRLQRLAGQRALDDVRNYLYDQTFRTDLANFLSPMMPFSNAIADALFKWTKIAMKRPLDVAANWNLIYNFPERAGLIYDQDGNSLQTKDGKEVWIDKLTGQPMPDGVQHDRYVAFTPPSWFADKIPGGLKLMMFNKNSMTSAIFDPSINVGPLIALPVNQFALYDPEVGDSQFVKTYVLPFGPTDKQSNFLLPGLVGAAKKFFTEDQDQASSSAMAIYQTQLTDVQKGLRSTPANLDEAKEQARHLQWLRFASSGVSPVSFQYKSPYQPYIDLYSQLLRKHGGDTIQADDEFRRIAGDEYMYLAARVTKTNIALPATIKGYKMFQDKQNAIMKYPELASLITGQEGAGSFSKSVYEWEKQQSYDETGKKIREEQPISESIKDLQRRMGWSDWVKYNAQITNDLTRRGLTSINDKGAEDIKQRYSYWIAMKMFTPGPHNEMEVSPWYEDFRSTDGAAMDNRLAQMQQILEEHPDWVKSRTELQGLAQYLDMRRQMKARMDQLGFATLDSQKAQWLQDAWDSQVLDLRSRYNAFDQLYARWLSRDTLGAEGLWANQIVTAMEAAYGQQPASQ